MKFEPIHHRAQEAVEISADLQLAEVEPDLFVYERTLALKASRASSLAKEWEASRTESGFVNAANAQKLIKNRPFEKLKLSVMTDQELESVRTQSWMESMKRADFRRSVFQMLAKHPELTVDNVVFPDWGNHTVSDRHGNPLPMAKVFEYSHSGIDESTYDLEALAAILLAHPDVRVLHHDTKTPEGKLATNVREAIFDIPYYSATEERSQSIQFVWVPKPQDYQKVWAWAKERTPGYPTSSLFKGFLELDIAGTLVAKRPEVLEDEEEPVTPVASRRSRPGR